MSEKSLWLLIFILVYAAFCFFWGVRGSNYNSDSPEKFYLANKNIFVMIFLTLGFYSIGQKLNA